MATVVKTMDTKQYINSKVKQLVKPEVEAILL